MSVQIHSYSELQQQIHEDLRIQHPDWVEPNGDCPTCDSYESRLAELVGLSQRARRLFDCANHLVWATPAMIENRRVQ